MRRTAATTAMFAMIVLGAGSPAFAAPPLGPTDIKQPPVTLQPQPQPPTDLANPTEVPQPEPDPAPEPEPAPETDAPEPGVPEVAQVPVDEPAAVSPHPTQGQKTGLPELVRAQATTHRDQDSDMLLLASAALLMAGAVAAAVWVVAARRRG